MTNSVTTARGLSVQQRLGLVRHTAHVCLDMQVGGVPFDSARKYFHCWLDHDYPLRYVALQHWLMRRVRRQAKQEMRR